MITLIFTCDIGLDLYFKTLALTKVLLVRSPVSVTKAPVKMMSIAKLTQKISVWNITSYKYIQNYTPKRLLAISSSVSMGWSGNLFSNQSDKTTPRCYWFPSTRSFSTSQIKQADRILKSPLPDLEIPESTFLLDYVTQNWHEFGDKKAFIDSQTEASITYNELRDKFTRFGSALARQGFKKGDVATISLPNCIEFAIVYYGAMSIGMIVNAINPSHTTDELAYAVNLVETKLLIVSPSTVETARRASAKCSSIKGLICVGGSEGFQPLSTLLEDDGKALPDSLDVDARNDVTSLSFSSGTTGLPKAVMLTSYCIVANLLQMGSPQMLNVVKDDVHIGVLPLFHAAGHILLLLSNRVGATGILMSAFEPTTYLHNVETYKPTYLIVVPPILVFFAKHPMVQKCDFSSVRQVAFAAAPASPSIIAEAKEKLGRDIPYMQVYGMTEFSPFLTMTPSHKPRSDTVGVPMHNSALKIRDITTNELLGPNEEGEICGYGPQIMKGYWKNEEATKETIVDGWIHTGDIGFYDDEGYLVITDRLKELIKYKGFQVAPAELEGLLLTHPGIQDVAVIGKPDEMAGELPRAYVVMKPGATATQEDIQYFIRARTAPHKYLRGGVEFRSEIPKAASGKILRRLLKDELTGAK